MVYPFRDAPSTEGNHRRAAQQRLGQYHREWLLPFDGQEQGGGAAEQLVLSQVVHGSDVGDEPPVDEGLDFPREVRALVRQRGHVPRDL